MQLLIQTGQLSPLGGGQLYNWPHIPPNFGHQEAQTRVSGSTAVLCTSKWSPQICFIIQPSPVPHTWPLCLLWSGFYFLIHIYFFVHFCCTLAQSFAEQGVLSVIQITGGSWGGNGRQRHWWRLCGVFSATLQKMFHSPPTDLHLPARLWTGSGCVLLPSPWLLSGSLLLGLQL